MLPTNREPTHPGEILLKDFLEPMEITQKAFASHLGWTYAKLNEIVHGKRGITADSALALGDAFNMEAEFWLGLQQNWELWRALKKHKHVEPIYSEAA
ncbi:MAG: HigA family addiction module antidote protein [Gammaproteobacteria bacterium]|nr:HigA family addiction module antidote protein [Gammaproteobacteria bacterium]